MCTVDVFVLELELIAEDLHKLFEFLDLNGEGGTLPVMR
jgi:hypothetical protein